MWICTYGGYIKRVTSLDLLASVAGLTLVRADVLGVVDGDVEIRLLARQLHAEGVDAVGALPQGVGDGQAAGFRLAEDVERLPQDHLFIHPDLWSRDVNWRDRDGGAEYVSTFAFKTQSAILIQGRRGLNWTLSHFNPKTTNSIKCICFSLGKRLTAAARVNMMRTRLTYKTSWTCFSAKC